MIRQYHYAETRPGNSIDAVAGSDIINWYFFAFVRMLERANWLNDLQDSATHRRLEAVDFVDFRSQSSLGFPLSEVGKCTGKNLEGRWRYQVELGFWGLLGAVGALAPHVTRLAQDYGDQDRSILRDFLAIFESRSAQLRYLAEEKASWLYSWESQHNRLASSTSDQYTELASSLIGIGYWSQHDQRLNFPIDVAMFHVGHLSNVRRPAISLALVLEDFLGAPVHVSENLGYWQSIDDGLRTKLGKDADNRFPEQDAQNTRLGVSMCAGRRVWSCQDSFLISIGPLDIEEFEKLLPKRNSIAQETSLFDAVADLTRLFVGAHFRFSIQLILKAKGVPSLVIGSRKTKLGWNTWLITEPPTKPARDCVLAGPQRLPNRTARK